MFLNDLRKITYSQMTDVCSKEQHIHKFNYTSTSMYEIMAISSIKLKAS